jgi:hypothetical protein
MILAEGHPLFPADVLHFPFTDRIAPFDRAERSLRRGRSFLLCLLLRCAFRAEALEDRGMRIDSPGIAPLRERTQVGRCLGIERLVFMDADVHDLAAADADHMGVLIRTKAMYDFSRRTSTVSSRCPSFSVHRQNRSVRQSRAEPTPWQKLPSLPAPSLRIPGRGPGRSWHANRQSRDSPPPRTDAGRPLPGHRASGLHGRRRP